MRTLVTLKINGTRYQKAILPTMTLLDFLRDELHLTGTKRGCDTGDCGCCTVLVNGRAVLSCLLLACEVACEAVGKSTTIEIQTIEGIADGEKLHPIQEAMVEEGAIQCGFCTPAMVLNTYSLLGQKPKPTASEIKECVSGTICRCTGYSKLSKAVASAAKKMGGHP